MKSRRSSCQRVILGKVWKWFVVGKEEGCGTIVTSSQGLFAVSGLIARVSPVSGATIGRSWDYGESQGQGEEQRSQSGILEILVLDFPHRTTFFPGILSSGSGVSRSMPAAGPSQVAFCSVEAWLSRLFSLHSEA